MDELDILCGLFGGARVVAADCLCGSVAMMGVLAECAISDSCSLWGGVLVSLSVVPTDCFSCIGCVVSLVFARSNWGVMLPSVFVSPFIIRGLLAGLLPISSSQCFGAGGTVVFSRAPCNIFLFRPCELDMFIWCLLL